ncbi:MAG: M6 family metalloprotease domain-containing protein [Bacteroidales bacterium]|nr:M6 family metalloprotease domain-containing protein [Bacteroidales bacterium]
MEHVFRVVFSLMLWAIPYVMIAHDELPPRRVQHTITQPSGEQIVLTRVSDEHRLFWLTPDDAPTWYDVATQTHRYALVQPDLSLIYTPVAVSLAPSETSRKAAASMRFWREPHVETRVAATQQTAVLRALGSPRIPVLLVEFTDTTFQSFNTIVAMDSMLNGSNYAYEGGNGSVKAYFDAQSDGKFTPNFEVVGLYRLPHPMRYYGANQGSLTDVRWKQMVEETVAMAMAEGKDFAPYKDGSGSIPTVAIIFAGQGEHVSGVGHDNRLYPKMSNGHFAVNGLNFRSRFISPEVYYRRDVPYREGIGTFVHEFSHVLGLPDFYDTSTSAVGYGADIWSVMDLGMHSGNRYSPIGYMAYERAFMGWLDIPTLEEAAEVTLNPLTQRNAMHRAVKIANPYDANEYFILENRQPSRFFPSVLGFGLMITHVAYDATAWRTNRVNAIPNKQRLYIVPADGQQSGYMAALTTLRSGKPIDTAFYNLRNDFFPGTEGRYTAFSSTSLRPMAVYNSDGNGTPGVLDKPIYNIRINLDRTVSFTFLDSTLTAIPSVNINTPLTAQPTRIYTLSGLHVATLPFGVPHTTLALPRGIYVRVSGHQSCKFIVD